ncbi:hypothetical protein Ga0100231_000595 [Opitutaceae bacterium TAV4]|nr:hypothetical protein Ga0100231_000595 [Opitutaceae bacterium TAV4]
MNRNELRLTGACLVRGHVDVEATVEPEEREGILSRASWRGRLLHAGPCGGRRVAGRGCADAGPERQGDGRPVSKNVRRAASGNRPEADDAQKNTTRREAGRNVSNRRVFYDFTISPPKSVSVVALMQDARIVAAHDRAARKMVDEMEKFAETRVRRGGANGERVTGAVAAALFRHDTSRELDPHLHTHCVLFNATFDGVEGQWKALHASGMYRAQKFAENVYYHELARELVSLGYQIKKPLERI